MGLTTLFKKPLLSVVIKKDGSPSRNRGHGSRSHGIYGNILPRLDELECKLKKIKKASKKAFKDDPSRQKPRSHEQVCNPCEEVPCDVAKCDSEREKSVCIVEETVCDNEGEKKVCSVEENNSENNNEKNINEEEASCNENKSSIICVAEPDGSSSYATTLTNLDDNAGKSSKSSQENKEEDINRTSSQFLRVPKVEITSPSFLSEMLNNNAMCSQASQVTVHHLSSHSNSAVEQPLMVSAEIKVSRDGSTSNNEPNMTRNLSMYVCTDDQKKDVSQVTSVASTQIDACSYRKQVDQSSQTNLIVEFNSNSSFSKEENQKNSGDMMKQRSSECEAIAASHVSSQISKLSWQSKKSGNDEKNICNAILSKLEMSSSDNKNKTTMHSKSEVEVINNGMSKESICTVVQLGQNDQCVSSVNVQQNTSFYDRPDSNHVSSISTEELQSQSILSQRKKQSNTSKNECFVNDEKSKSKSIYSHESVNTIQNKRLIQLRNDETKAYDELSKDSFQPNYKPSHADIASSTMSKVSIDHNRSLFEQHEDKVNKSLSRVQSPRRASETISNDGVANSLSKQTSTMNSNINQINISRKSVSLDTSNLEKNEYQAISSRGPEAGSKILKVVGYVDSKLSNQIHQIKDAPSEHCEQCLTSKFSLPPNTSLIDDKHKSGIGDFESIISLDEHHDTSAGREEVIGFVKGQSSNISTLSNKCPHIRKLSESITSPNNCVLFEEKKGSGGFDSNTLSPRKSLIDITKCNVNDGSQNLRSSNKSFKQNSLRENCPDCRREQKSGVLSHESTRVSICDEKLVGYISEQVSSLSYIMNEQSSSMCDEHRRGISNSKRKPLSKQNIPFCNEKLMGCLTEHVPQKLGPAIGGTEILSKKSERNSRNIPLTLHVASFIDNIKSINESEKSTLTSFSDQTFKCRASGQSWPNIKYQMKLNIDNFDESSGAKLIKQLPLDKNFEKELSEKGISGLITDYTCSACEEIKRKNSQDTTSKKSFETLMINKEPKISKKSDLPNTEGFNLEHDPLKFSNIFKMGQKLDDDACEESFETQSNNEVGQQNVTVAMLTDVIPHEAGESSTNYMMVHCTGCHQVCLAKVLEILTTTESSEDL